MSLIALSRYDDAEDEIRDEDHNLAVVNKSPETISAHSEPSSRPPSDLGGKPKSLVSYIGGEYSDEDESSYDDDGDDDDTPVPSVVNLGLFDSSNVLSSAGSGSPSSVLDTFDGIERSREPIDGVRLPPEPEGRCSKSLQEKIAKMIEKKKNGMNVNNYVQTKKEFRNPSIYEKLVSFIGIDEHGSNFPKHLYDPNIWEAESFYDALAKAQKEHHDKKEKEKLKRTHVEFISGTKKPLQAVASSTATIDSTKKSKWDQKIPPSVQSAIKSSEKPVK